MLYYLLIYQSESNTLLYEKDFEIDDKGQMDLFGDFFSALKLFLSELRIHGSKALKTIGLGNLIAFITQLPDLNIDLVIISDKEDSKIIKNLTSKIEKIILKNKEIFTTATFNSTQVQEFDEEMNQFILSEPKLFNLTTLIKKKDEILKSIYDQKGKISQQLREEKERFSRMEKERIFFFKKKLENEENLIKRYRICNKVIEISEKPEDENINNTYRNLAHSIDREIKERKLKLDYYFSKTIESLKNVLNTYSGIHIINANFHEVYSNLYSFSLKLKNIAPDSIYQKYLSISRKLINKSEMKDDDFAELISKILQMENDSKLKSYLN